MLNQEVEQALNDYASKTLAKYKTELDTVLKANLLAQTLIGLNQPQDESIMDNVSAIQENFPDPSTQTILLAICIDRLTRLKLNEKKDQIVTAK